MLTDSRITYVVVALAVVVSVKSGAPFLEGQAPWEWIGGFQEKGFEKAIPHLLPFGSFLVVLAVIFSSTSALNSTIYSATRAAYALGRDNMLPRKMATIHPVRKTPWVALLLTAILLLSVVLFVPNITDVVSSASLMFIFLFLLVNACVIKIRRNMGDELTYGFLIPLFPFLPLLAIACQVALIAYMHEMSKVACVIAPLWILLGGGIFYFYSRSRATITEDEILVLEEEKHLDPEPGRYRIMLALANPASAVEMVRNTYKLCTARQASVELLHMVQVPDQVPLSDAKKYMDEGREGIVEAMLYLAPQFTISTTLRYCRSIARGIISAIRQKRIGMLIMGWHGAPAQGAFKLGSKVDPIIERAPCDVVVMKNCSYKEYSRVLIPLAGGPNGALALEVAAILASKEKGRVTIMTVKRGGSAPRRDFDIKAYVQDHMDKLALPADRFQTRIVESDDVATAILKETNEGDYDLVVLGATREPFLKQMTSLTVPDIIAQRCQKPVVMVKAAAGLRSWIKRWI